MVRASPADIENDLPDDELRKLAGKTVKKGEDEYVIVVQGVDSGLRGKYWGDMDNLPSRRSSRKDSTNSQADDEESKKKKKGTKSKRSAK